MKLHREDEGRAIWGIKWGMSIAIGLALLKWLMFGPN